VLLFYCNAVLLFAVRAACTACTVCTACTAWSVHSSLLYISSLLAMIQPSLALVLPPTDNSDPFPFPYHPSAARSDKVSSCHISIADISARLPIACCTHYPWLTDGRRYATLFSYSVTCNWARDPPLLQRFSFPSSFLLSLSSYPCWGLEPFSHYHVVIMSALALIALIFLSHMGPCFTLTFPHVSYLGSWLISQSAFNRYLWLILISLCSFLHLVVTWSVRRSLMYIN